MVTYKGRYFLVVRGCRINVRRLRALTFLHEQFFLWIRNCDQNKIRYCDQNKIFKKWRLIGFIASSWVRLSMLLKLCICGQNYSIRGKQSKFYTM